MKSRFISLLVVCSLFTSLVFAQKYEYPKPKKVEQTDTYHGTMVSDPYRWMETADTPELTSWIEAENKLTDSYFEQIPQREAIKDRLTKLWNYERYFAPSKRGKHYFYSKNDGLQNQNVMYITDSLATPAAFSSTPTSSRPTAQWP